MNKKNLHQEIMGSGYDAFRHKRIVGQIHAFAEYFKNDSWLTIGDGRFGAESIYLKELFGIVDITTSDIEEERLELSKKEGLIDHYEIIDAESITFPDNSFDVVFCKEAYHHFPHAPTGLFEMMRVCKKAVILLEPFDQRPKSWFQKLRDKIKSPQEFETVGNFVYTISLNEVYKSCTSMQFKYIAWKGYEDHFSSAQKNENLKLILFRVASILKKILSFIGYKKPGHVACILLKNNDAINIDYVKSNGFRVKKIPVNPYL